MGAEIVIAVGLNALPQLEDGHDKWLALRPQIIPNIFIAHLLKSTPKLDAVLGFRFDATAFGRSKFW
jgi:hypothetical protein